MTLNENSKQKRMSSAKVFAIIWLGNYRNYPNKYIYSNIVTAVFALIVLYCIITCIFFKQFSTGISLVIYLYGYSCFFLASTQFKSQFVMNGVEFLNQNLRMPWWASLFPFGTFFSVDLNDARCISVSGPCSSSCYFYVIHIYQPLHSGRIWHKVNS